MIVLLFVVIIRFLRTTFVFCLAIVFTWHYLFFISLYATMYACGCDFRFSFDGVYFLPGLDVYMNVL